MIPYEILMSIYRSSGTNLKAIANMESFLEELRNNPNYADDFEKELIEFKNKTVNGCPICQGNIVKIKSYSESRGEYFGRPVSETINKYGCENCGYILS